MRCFLWNWFSMIGIPLFCFGCYHRVESTLLSHEAESVSKAENMNRMESVNVVFCDFHRSEGLESVEVAGKELELKGNLDSLFSRLGELNPRVVVVG